MVNVVLHGHEPSLSEMIVAASQDPEIIEYAKAAGAAGVNLSGICCTANEILMRQGIPAAGNFLHQELAIMTGAVEAMVVDVQCIMQALVGLAENFHTKIITTSPKVKIKGATHIEFDEHHALTVARTILKTAIDNFKNRDASKTHIPQIKEDLIPGLLARVHQLHAGRFLPGLVPPAQRCHHGGAHPRRGRDRGLQQPAVQPGLPAQQGGARTAEAGCARRADRLRRNRLGQARTHAGRGRAWTRWDPACARSAKPSAYRRSCTWVPAWTTRASSPCSPRWSKRAGWATTSIRSRPLVWRRNG